MMWWSLMVLAWIVTTETVASFKMINYQADRPCQKINAPWKPGYIANGEVSKEHEFPFAVHLRNGCGGAIITSRHILTAAHCIAELRPMSIAYGSADKTRQIVLSSDHIDRISIHYEFKGQTGDTDIAVISLRSPLPLDGRKASHICVLKHPLESLTNITKPTIVTIGWGSTAPTGDLVYQDLLLKTKQQMLDKKYCEAHWADIYEDTERPRKDLTGLFCLDQSRSGVCSGDSGSPVLMKNGRYWALIGVVSHGQIKTICAKKGAMTAHTDLSEQNEWIWQVTKLVPSNESRKLYYPENVYIQALHRAAVQVTNSGSYSKISESKHPLSNSSGETSLPFLLLLIPIIHLLL